MSDFNDFYNKELPLLMLVGLVTLPIWLPIWGIWYVFVGYKEEKKIKKELPPVIITPRPPRPPPKKPKFYNSYDEWKKFNP